MFINYITQQITIQKLTGRDEYNHPTYGTGVSLLARFQNQTSEYQTQQGNILTSTGIFYVTPNTDVAEDDIITFNGKVYKVIGVQFLTKHYQDSHKVIHVQVWQLP